MQHKRNSRPAIRGRTENALPSYASATSQDHWTIVAPYIQSADLCSAALVCERWHEMFAPHLWGNPASHFGTGDDAVYVALTRFRRTLAWARLYVRQMTHTLHMPPAHAELYEGPHSDWLRDILERLPNLQSLIVNGLPFFDHGSLLTLRHFSPARRPPNPQAFPTFALRFLDARQCANATPSGLTEALRHFPSLLHLDLSKTIVARSPAVLATIGTLRNLQILKLADLCLRDEDIALFAGKLGTRLRSLDVRNNNLTDKSARILLIKCFNLAYRATAPQNGSFTEEGSFSMRLPGSSDPFSDDALLFHQGPDLDEHIRRQLTTELSERLVIEDTSHSGITHLYIANNKFTAEGVAGLLRSGSLHVLDCGDVARFLPDELNQTLHSEMKLPGVSKILPVIAGPGSHQLTYLRVNHSIVTEDVSTLQPDLEPPSATATELSAENELDGTTLHHVHSELQELDPDSVLAELEGPVPTELEDTGTERFELPGDSVYFRITPAHVFDTPPEIEEEGYTLNTVSSATNSNTLSSIESGVSTVMAKPNGYSYDNQDDNSSVILNSSGTGLNPDFAAMNGISASSNDHATTASTCEPSPINDIRPSHHHRSYSSVVAERRARSQINKTHPTTLHPSMVSKLSTLVLTDVPARVDNLEPIHRLTAFITACAEEATLARLQAELGYAMPPGTRGHKSAQREYARSIFALGRIVLELAPTDAGVGQRKPAAPWRKYPTKSSTEDADSEAFWDAAQYDFSFFGDEECGLPTVQGLGRGHLFSTTSSDKIVVGPEDVPFYLQQQHHHHPHQNQSAPQSAYSRTMSPQSPYSTFAPQSMQSQSPSSQHLQFQYQQQPQPLPMYDVVAELAKFRRERKTMYEAKLALGEQNPEVEGYWEGEVKVVRPVQPVLQSAA